MHSGSRTSKAATVALWLAVILLVGWQFAHAAGSAPTVNLIAPPNNAMFSAPAAINLSAMAADIDGGVTKVEFYRNCSLLAAVASPSSGTASSGTWTHTDTNVPAGNHRYLARVYDNGTPAAVTTSSAALVSVSGVAASSVNVAAQLNGAVAAASSSYSAAFGPAAVINGDRSGANSGNGGTWIAATPGSFPDWVQVSFAGMQTIGQIDVFSIQDAWQAPVEPTASMTFTQYGVTAFQVQYWTGNVWADVPDGNVSGNNLVWRRFTFAPISTDRIRVLVNASTDGYSRLAEIQAWTVDAGAQTNRPPTATLTSPPDNTISSTPVTLDLSVTAEDTDGGVSKVEFYRDCALLAAVMAPTAGTPGSGTWTYSDNAAPIGNHTYSAKIYDTATPPAVATTREARVSVNATNAASLNVAAQSNGGLATASSAHSAAYGPAAVINGDRSGSNSGSGGTWIDGTPGSFPDSVQIAFAGLQTIGRIDVFSIQDDWQAPVEPNTSMTFTKYGVTAFQVQYWTGSAWADVPGGNVTGNNLVWRTFAFNPITTDRIRVVVNAGSDGYTRLAEIEAWTVSEGAPPSAPPTANLTSPPNNTLISAPATVDLSVAAADADGSITKVEFYRNDALIATVISPTSGTPSSGTWTHTDTSVPAGNYRYFARVYDNGTPAAVTTSGTALVSVSGVAASSANVATQAHGAVATASSSHSASYGPTAVINGDRSGANSGNGGTWIAGTPGNFPDWVQVSFAGVQTIGQIDVFTIQDNWEAPAEPTSTMTFTKYGVTAFQVQYWTGNAWADVPDGNVTGNNLVWRRFAFAPISTDRIRVLVTATTDGYSRLAEVQAWTQDAASSPPSLVLQSLAGGFVSPVGVEHAGDGSGRLFVVEQGGLIKIVDAGGVRSTPFLNIVSLISTGGERGLLGVAFHPNYAQNGLFYVNYTRRADGATVIARYQRSASDPNVADSAASILLVVAQPFSNHNGGQLRFGRDGYLYIALGDGGSANDPGNRAQNLSTLLGKMLRIDVNSGSPYSIPPDNPFANDGNANTLGEIWASGLRNPWRFSFDRATGDLFIADVGQGSWEEINFQAAGSGSGANYGWRVMEGNHCTSLGGGPACFSPTLTPPILEYSHSLGCSVTGGYRYRGSAYPSLNGLLIFGDFCSGRIWAGRQFTGGGWSMSELLLAGFNISTFGEDEAGELYVAAYNTGTLYRVVGR